MALANAAADGDDGAGGGGVGGASFDEGATLVHDAAPESAMAVLLSPDAGPAETLPGVELCATAASKTAACVTPGGIGVALGVASFVGLSSPTSASLLNERASSVWRSGSALMRFRAIDS
jgi:hypothetical protein